MIVKAIVTYTSGSNSRTYRYEGGSAQDISAQVDADKTWLATEWSVHVSTITATYGTP